MLTRVLAVAVAILALVSIHFYSQTSQLRTDLAAAQTPALARARHIAADSMDGEGAEIQRVMAWLDAYYKSPDGLQRPEGLWINGHPDYEGIGTWIFDVYLRNRLRGLTEAEAENIIGTEIMKSDEWRTKHKPKG